MGVNSLPKTATRGCDLNPGPSAIESSTLTTRLPSMTGQKRQLRLVNTRTLFVSSLSVKFCVDKV